MIKVKIMECKCEKCIFLTPHKGKNNVSLRPEHVGYCCYPGVKKRNLDPLGNCDYYIPKDIPNV